ncbi:MAG: sodium:calcium symporter [Verrucomicrobia bacterium]|nr:MAG: sodium:calcium symporter [Verrucomicrobiota bacterium]
MSTRKTSENWSSRLGVIMAVAGSAVGLGNFLRFPGQAAQYGGGAFMIAYFISLLIIGVSICWAEWTLGRWGGRYGFHSSPGIFGALLRHPAARYVGIIGVIIPCGVYMYYVYIEAWCLGYAVQFLTGHLGSPEVDYPAHFAHFVGMNQDGFAIGLGLTQVGLFVIAVYALNFYLIYRGLSRGIEMFCKFAMPALIAIALVIVVRVLTLGTPNPEFPERNVLNGLGFMWNPGNVGEQLANPQLWLAAAGQIFFSLSVGFGVILTYASYLTDRDDIVLSGLTATSANEFCEVGLGGLMTLPAAFIYLGSAGVAGGTFGLGFNVLPIVFANMPFGQVFGFLFFLLLFLAAVTSSLSMLQPGIAFLEEALGIGRRMSVTLLGMMTVTGTMFVWYYSKDLKALDTIDFWVGTFLIFVQGTILVIVFAWVIGTEKGFAEAHKGSTMRIPRVFGLVMKYLCPAFLLGIFFMWLGVNVLGWNASFSDPQFNPTGYTLDLVGSEEHPPSAVARLSVGMIVVMALFIGIITHLAGRRWNAQSSTRGGAQ